jgi:hypothetical protein
VADQSRGVYVSLSASLVVHFDLALFDLFFSLCLNFDFRSRSILVRCPPRLRSLLALLIFKVPCVHTDQGVDKL